MKVRRAGPDDFSALRPLVAALHTEEELPTTAATDAALRSLLSDPRLGRVLLVELGDTVVAYLVLGFGFSLEFHGLDAFVDELFVAEGQRDLGLGTRLLEAAERECREAGVVALRLEVAHGNRARALYERQGYVAHERHLMTKWLGPASR